MFRGKYVCMSDQHTEIRPSVLRSFGPSVLRSFEMWKRLRYFIPVTHITVLILSVFIGSSLIRLYGNTCGINILDPATWLRIVTVAGSPWCKALNWTSYATTHIIDHMWLHIIGVSATGAIAKLTTHEKPQLGPCNPNAPPPLLLLNKPFNI